MRVVLDTNVIVSGLNFRGNEERVLDLARRRRVDLYLSPFILAEASSVLLRKFRWEHEATERALGRLREAATLVEPHPGPPVIEGNVGDNRVLECAVQARADFLVTGDRRHLLPLGEHQGVTIVNAPRFLSSLETSP